MQQTKLLIIGNTGNVTPRMPFYNALAAQFQLEIAEQAELLDKNEVRFAGRALEFRLTHIMVKPCFQRTRSTSRLPRGVMVAQQVLVLLVPVRTQAG